MLKILTRKYWKELLLFGVIATVYGVCTAPGYSWVGMDNDCFNFAYAALFQMTPHIPGYPVHTLITTATVQLPFGADGWKLAFFGSAIPSIITCILVFIVVRKQTTNKWAPYIAATSLAGCNVFLMQSIIAEVYATASLFLVATYTAFIFHKEKTTAILAGFAFGTHPFMIPGAALLVFLNVRKRYWAIPVAIGAGLYGYCFAVNSLFTANYIPITVKLWRLFGSAPLWYFPTKLEHTSILLVCGFALALIPAIWYFKNLRRSWIVIGLMIVPVMFWLTRSTPASYVHFQIIFPFIAIAAGLGIEKIKIRPEPILAVSALLLLIMPAFYDIGRNLDEDLSAQAYYNGLSELPDDSVVFNYIVIEGDIDCGIDERCAVAMLVHNMDKGSHLIPIDIGKYVRLDDYGEAYRKALRDEVGLETPIFALLVYGDTSGVVLTLSDNHAHALADKNPDVEFYYNIIPVEKCMNRNLTRMYAE